MRFKLAPVFLIFVIQYIFVSWSADPPQFEQRGDRPISNVLKSIAYGQSSEITTSGAALSIIFPKLPEQRKKPLTKWGKTHIRKQQQTYVDNLISSTVTRFQGKHLFNNGIKEYIFDDSGVPKAKIPDSYAALTKCEACAKTYLIDLHLKLYKGGVLPQQPENQFKDWFSGAKDHYITIVDADLGILQNDIVDQPAIPVTKETKGRPDQTYNHYDTTNKHKVTQISFVDDPVNKRVIVYAQQYDTGIQLSKHNEILNHVEKLLPDEGKQIPPLKQIASFTYEELKKISLETEKFWKFLVPKQIKAGVLLNEEFDLYQIKKKAMDLPNNQESHTSTPTSGYSCGAGSSGRRKRAAGGGGCGCAFCKRPNGDVNSVHPKEFIEEYEKADEHRKRKLAQLANKNINKIEDGVDSENTKKMKKLLQNEYLKRLVANLNNVAEVEISKTIKSSDMAPWLDKITTNFFSEKNKLSVSKIAKNLKAAAESKGIKGAGKVSSSLGGFFLAKTVINGINKEDTTSLAIVVGRIGLDVGIGSLVRTGKKHLIPTTLVAKGTKILGKLAGPLGAAADIGLSIWSITKSVGRLKNATNPYDKIEAIVSIASESYDIANTVRVTVLSIAFPPAAPLISALAAAIDLRNKIILSVFNTAIEVAKINSEIPLHKFEKIDVFTTRLFDWFGTRKKDYIDNLLEEKSRNNMVVQHNLAVLENNPSFLGIVFPSRTLIHYDENCNTLRDWCSPFNYNPFYGCKERFNNYKFYSSGCDSSIVYDVDKAFFKYKCTCGVPITEFGFPRENSYVDFQAKQNLFLERSVPKDVEKAEFKCKPGNTDYQGYKVSNKNSNFDYLCENAIGLLKPSRNRTNSQVMVYDLKDGHDRVFLSWADLTPNLFIVGNEGIKEFQGGVGRNEFLLDGDCTKSLEGSLSGGGSHNDTILISESCSKGKEIYINFATRKLQSRGENVDLSFNKIEDVIGRKGESERVVASCETRNLVLGGGTYSQADNIEIPSLSCALELTLHISGYTNVNSKATRGDLQVRVESPWNLVDIKGDIGSYGVHNFDVFFVDTTSSDVFLENFDVTGRQLQATIGKSKTVERAKFYFSFGSSSSTDRDVHLTFMETPERSPKSMLILSLDNSPVLYHPLPNFQNPTRRGHISIPNSFEVIGHSWTVFGGDKSDEFILHTPYATLDGGKGEDTLRLHANFRTSAPLDLTGQSIKNIENVYGIKGYPLTIKTSCDTKLVVPLGGSYFIPDVVLVPATRCSIRDLQILAKGHTRVAIEGDVGYTPRDGVIVVGISEINNPLRLELETKTKTTSGLLVLIQSIHKDWRIYNISKNAKTNSLQVHLVGNKGEFIKLNLYVTSQQGSTQYLDIPHIEFSQTDSNQPDGVFVIETETNTPKVIYTLDKSILGRAPSSLKIVGFKEIQNMFRIIAAGHWNVTGGNKDDVFSTFHISGISIHGGGGQDNTLLLESHSNSTGQTFFVNLEKGEIGLLHYTQKGRVTNIHHIVGRQSQPDVIHASCSTKSIAGSGGNREGVEDIIFISENICPNNTTPKMTLQVGNHTKVKNSAKRGQFTYHVENLLTADIELSATANNTHFVKFASDPWTLIENTTFNRNNSVLGLKMKSGRVQEFPMFRKYNSREYINPVFQFHRPGSSVSSDIQVDANGAITSTFNINGNGPSASERVSGIPVHLNRFLISITSPSSSSGIIEGSEKSGGNQFWVFNLNHNLNTLDGGNCMDSTECTNYLQFGESFQTGKSIEIDLQQKTGSLKVSGKVLIQNLKNMQEITGRRNEQDYDKVHVTCDIKSVSDFEEIRIHPAPENKECLYNLVLGIGERTRVVFEENENHNYSLEDTFHYKFTTPRSFSLEGSEFMTYDGTHIYNLPFTLDDLEGIHFDVEEEQLYYSMSGKEYHLEMIDGIRYIDQFYKQPVLVTNDSFFIQVGFDGSILLSLGTSGSFPSLEEVQNQGISAFGTKAQRLGVSIMIITDKEFLYVGHGNNGERNVLQSFGNLTNHLVGGGANDTIYDITSLENDIHIYPGFQENNSEDFGESNGTKQTVDLTDI